MTTIPGIRSRLYLEDSRPHQTFQCASLSRRGCVSFVTRMKSIRADPLYGRDACAVFLRSRIVFNGAVGLPGEDRGNVLRRSSAELSCFWIRVLSGGSRRRRKPWWHIRLPRSWSRGSWRTHHCRHRSPVFPGNRDTHPHQEDAVTWLPNQPEKGPYDHPAHAKSRQIC